MESSSQATRPGTRFRFILWWARTCPPTSRSSTRTCARQAFTKWHRGRCASTPPTAWTARPQTFWARAGRPGKAGAGQSTNECSGALAQHLPDFPPPVVRVPDGVLGVDRQLPHQRRPRGNLVARHLAGGRVELDEVVSGPVELAEPDMPGGIDFDGIRPAPGPAGRVVFLEGLRRRVE